MDKVEIEMVVLKYSGDFVMKVKLFLTILTTTFVLSSPIMAMESPNKPGSFNTRCPEFTWNFLENLSKTSDGTWLRREWGYLYNADSDNQVRITKILNEKKAAFLPRIWTLQIDNEKQSTEKEKKCHYKVTSDVTRRVVGTFTVSYVYRVEGFKKQQLEPKISAEYPQEKNILQDKVTDNRDQAAIGIKEEPRKIIEQKIPSEPIPEKTYPYMDVALGIKFLHDQGLTGKGVTVGVIDVTQTGQNVVGKMKGFKGAIVEGSDPFSLRQGCHSSHVSGIICGQKIEGRTSVAPDSKVFFKAYFPFSVKTEMPIKCEVIASEDWVFEEGTLKKGSKVTVHQPSMNYGDSKLAEYTYQGKVWTPILTDESSTASGCTGGAKGMTSLYPGLVTHINYIGNEVDDHLSNTINSMNEKGIKIINFSVGSLIGSKTLEALRNFAENGGVFVIAAGNNGSTFLSEGYDNSKGYIIGDQLGKNFFSTITDNFPESVVLVGNLQESRHWGFTKTDFSLYHNSTKAGDLKNHYIAAWGTDVPSTIYTVYMPGWGWAAPNEYTSVTPTEKIKRTTEKQTGASQAAPMISAIIADLYQGFPQCTPLQIKDVLLKTASKENLIGTPDDYGMGMVDAKAAYEYLQKNGCSII